MRRWNGTSELGLLRSLGAVFSPGDVMLADACYCNYFLIATLRQLSVDVLFEQNGARSTDFHCGKALDRRDHLVRWPKPSTPPEWMAREQYQAFPDELTMREAECFPRPIVMCGLSLSTPRRLANTIGVQG